MPLFLYLDRQSFVHRRHPLVKVLALLLFFVAAFVMEHPLFILPLSAGIGALVLLSGSAPTLYRLRILFLFIGIFTTLIWSFFYGRGARLAALPFLPVTQEGILFGLGMATKLSTFLATSALFLSTTRIEEFAYAFTLLGLPYRISFTLTLAFRLVPLFVEAAFTVIQAQRCRGLDIHRGNVLQRFRQHALRLPPEFSCDLKYVKLMAIVLGERVF